MCDPCCEKSNYKMSTVQNVMLRVTIVLAMLVAVVAILYLTPLPEKHFLSCDRPCHDLDWPMICRVKLVIESSQDISGNRSDVITVNRQIPGPPIQICQNDVLVIDVINKIQGRSVSLHWHGQLNNEAPYMDGVPLLTQCPIPSYTTFQYKFRASTPGTHFYHAYSDQVRNGGVYGALIVRRPEKHELERKHYNSDPKNHTIVVSEMPDGSLGLNGKSAGSDLSIFKLIRNRRYRFRLIYANGECPMTLSVDGHSIRVISLDGSPVTPVEADSLTLVKGERADFVVKTNQAGGEHRIRLRSCKGEVGALITYQSGGKAKREGGRTFDTGFCERGVCLGDVRALEKLPEKLKQHPGKVLYLSFGSRMANVNDKFVSRVYTVNNLTFTFPPSPLLTQLGEIPMNLVCDQTNYPEKCRNDEESSCECVHVEFIPSGSGVELVVINRDDEEHVFHLHGYRFYVVGHRGFNEVPSSDEIKSLDDRDELLKRNFNSPALKDTVRVPKKSAVALRFLANNPGFWMFRDEKSKGWTRGMDIVFQVGDSTDMVSTPTDFPTCGNYIGPDFFLM